VIISIASGKGGAGKTTVATNLAHVLSQSSKKRVRLLDCDVEEPNAHLFLRPHLTRRETVTTPVPVIDEERCDYCGKCAAICRFRAIAVLGGKTILTFPEMCHSCGGCLLVCPHGAISETGRELGILERGRAGDMEFVHGRLRVGEAMSPPLITRVREHSESGDINIIDAPPGTSCPVITAMRRTDFILLVTEPTPFGLHDLRLTVGAVRLLEIPFGLVINRADMGDRKVYEYARSERIPILLEIPFDRAVAEAYSRGELFTEKLPEWERRFLELYERIENLLEKSSCVN